MVAAKAAPPSASSSPGVDQAEREHDKAVYDLLVLEQRLATTERRLAEAEREQDRLAGLLAAAAADQNRAERDLTTTRSRLTARVRSMYIRGELSWLDFIAGSSDLRQLVDRTVLLSRVLTSEARLAGEIERARAVAVEAEASLRRATDAQTGLVNEAHALRGHLDQALTEQDALAARLGERLASAQADARAAHARMEAINRQAAEGASAGGDGGGGTPAGDTSRDAGASTLTTIGSAGPRAGRRLTVRATAYALPGTTATGVGVRYGIIAVDPRVIPLGTRLYVPGYGEGIAADTGGAVKGNRIDVWLPSQARAEEWGVKTLTITILD